MFGVVHHLTLAPCRRPRARACPPLAHVLARLRHELVRRTRGAALPRTDTLTHSRPPPSSPPYLYLSPSHRTPRPRRRPPPRPRSPGPPSPARPRPPSPARRAMSPCGSRPRGLRWSLTSHRPSPPAASHPRRRRRLAPLPGDLCEPRAEARRQRRAALLPQTCAYATPTSPAGTTASRPTSGRSACASSPSCSASSLWKRRARRTRSARDHPRIAPARASECRAGVPRDHTDPPIRGASLQSPPRGAGQRQGPALRGARARAAGEQLIRRVHHLPVPPRGQALKRGSEGQFRPLFDPV